MFMFQKVLWSPSDSCICNCSCTGDPAASAWPTYGYPWVVEVAKLVHVWQFVALWVCEQTRREVVVVGELIVNCVKRRLESGWMFVKETFAKFQIPQTQTVGGLR